MVIIDEDKLDKDIQKALSIHHKVEHTTVMHTLTLITFFIFWLFITIRITNMLYLYLSVCFGLISLFVMVSNLNRKKLVNKDHSIARRM